MKIQISRSTNMPMKYKPSVKGFRQTKPQHFYMKDTPTEQLLKDIKEARRQPKDLQKIRNELVRRGIV